MQRTPDISRAVSPEHSVSGHECPPVLRASNRAVRFQFTRFVESAIDFKLMKTKVLLCLAFVTVLFGGCVVQSIQPLFSEKDYIEYPALAGTWKQQDENKEIGVWIFSREGTHYKLVHSDEKGHRATFNVAAGKIGADVFLDFVLTDIEPKDSLNDLAQVSLIAAHAFAKLVKTNDALVLVAMDYEWLEKHLEANPKAIAHVTQDKRPILTASTEELKTFVAKYASDNKVFKNEVKLVPKL
jgi:hypothetical protein